MLVTAIRLRPASTATEDVEVFTSLSVLRDRARRVRFLEAEATVHDKAMFVMPAGAAPIPASSGKTVRHRPNRPGDRQLNRTLHTIVLTRLQKDEPTQAYANRRRTQRKPTAR
jgi:transposase